MRLELSEDGIPRLSESVKLRIELLKGLKVYFLKFFRQCAQVIVGKFVGLDTGIEQFFIERAEDVSGSSPKISLGLAHLLYGFVVLAS